jgi:hypothetical protein
MDEEMLQDLGIVNWRGGMQRHLLANIVVFFRG